jgi:deoxyribonuclease-4
VGSRFEELRLILDGVKDSERMGVCLDTCHVFAAGFDITSGPAVERTMGLFEDVVGEERLKVVHLNDSVGPLGGALDRHEHIGMGQIGDKGFRAFLRHGNVAKLPILMEVPIDDRRKDEENMKLVRHLIGA